MKEKIAIVGSGGGTNGAWGAGASIGVMEVLGSRRPDMFVCRSASAGTGAYCVAEQLGSLENIWANLLSTRAFIDLTRWINGILNNRYLVRKVFGEQDPLNVESIKTSPTKLVIAATNCNTGTLEHFAFDNDTYSLFDLIQASTAIPWFATGAVPIQGVPYCDPDASSSVNASLLYAFEQGADKIILIDVSQPDLLIQALFQIRLALHRRRIWSNSRSAVGAKKETHVPKNEQIFLLRPEREWFAQHHPFDNRQHVLQESLKAGRAMVKKKSEALVAFLESS